MNSKINSQEKILALTEATASLDLVQILRYLTSIYQEKELVFSTSLGQEDQVITDAIARHKLAIGIFTLDTGRLFPETYNLIDLTTAKYKKEITTYFPTTEEVEKLVKEKGFNSFYSSVENRKECCFIRKIAPLKRALAGVSVWITGLRAEQSENRGAMKMFEWDEGNKVIKCNPLINWTYQQTLAYLEEYKVPQNTLHSKGFISIGCQPCTRAIEEGENPRAGRWWWENSAKECGLHS